MDADTMDPTDGRKQGDWNSRYPRKAWIQIICEGLWLLVLFFLSMTMIFSVWKGWICSICSPTSVQEPALRKFVYYASAGMLGGTVFGIKYFYRSIARGWWHQDRVIWRLKSPLIATALALIVGALLDWGAIASTNPRSGAVFVSIGFLVGYFADKAIAKMYEVANVVFGSSSTTKSSDDK
jgi:hypothetical protein